MDSPLESRIKETVEISKKPRRKFTDEQKSEAVAIVRESEKSVNQVAREMGLTESALRSWVKKAEQAEQPTPESELILAEREELIHLRRELKRVKLERDFLKKVSTFFAKESSDSTS